MKWACQKCKNFNIYNVAFKKNKEKQSEVSLILRKWKKRNAGDIIILHICTKNYNQWGTVPEIQSETDRIFCPYEPFFALLPLNNLENEKFDKMKKLSGDVIIFQMCTKNHDHITYASWDMDCDWHIFCHFGSFFGLISH